MNLYKTVLDYFSFARRMERMAGRNLGAAKRHEEQEEKARAKRVKKAYAANKVKVEKYITKRIKASALLGKTEVNFPFMDREDREAARGYAKKYKLFVEEDNPERYNTDLTIRWETPKYDDVV